MAIQSRQMAQFSGEAGVLCTIYVEYEDSSMRISGVRCINVGSSPCYAAVIRENDRLMYSATFPSGETFIPVPTNGANRIDFIDDGRGHWRGVDFTARYPA